MGNDTNSNTQCILIGKGRLKVDGRVSRNGDIYFKKILNCRYDLWEE